MEFYKLQFYLLPQPQYEIQIYLFDTTSYSIYLIYYKSIKLSIHFPEMLVELSSIDMCSKSNADYWDIKMCQ